MAEKVVSLRILLLSRSVMKKSDEDGSNGVDALELQRLKIILNGFMSLNFTAR